MMAVAEAITTTSLQWRRLSNGGNGGESDIDGGNGSGSKS